MVLDEQGKYPEALQYYNKSLEIKIKVHGQDHPDTAKTHLNMGACYGEMGDSDKELKCYEYALPIFEKSHGPEHPLVANTKNKYACLNRSVYLNVHPGCLVCSIAGVLCQQGKGHEAISLLSQAHTIYQASYGPEHPQTQEIQRRLNVLRSAVPSSSASQTCPPSRQQHIRIGARIRARDLVSAPQHNGCSGVVVSFDSSKLRYGVQLDNGKALLLKPACVLQMAEVQFGNAGLRMP